MTSVMVDDDGGDLDRLVAELIAKQAREKSQGASSSSSSAGPSRTRPTNIRFLNRLMQDVETHNDALRKEELRDHARGQATGKQRPRVVQSSASSKMRAWSDDEDTRDSSHCDRTKRRRQPDRDWESPEDTVASSSVRPAKSRDLKNRASPPAASVSKMDKYFDKRYDPALDVSAETRTDDKGLVEDEGWDRMLGVLKEKEHARAVRKEEKRAEKEKERHRREKERTRRREERHAKRRRREGGSASEDEDHRRRRRHRYSPQDDRKQPTSSRADGASSLKATAHLLDVSFSKRGSTREWDKGKTSPT